MVDPWAGSYMMEALTEELIAKANIIIEEARARARARERERA